MAEESRCAAHEGLGPVRKQRFAGKERRRHGGQRRQQKHAPAAEGEPDHQGEPDQDADETEQLHGLKTMSSGILRRLQSVAAGSANLG